jgi:membrane protease YdiL (CAAX protease family)
MNVKLDIPVSYQAIIATVGLCAVIYLYYLGSGLYQLLAIALFLGVLYIWTGTIGSLSEFKLKKDDWPLNVGVGIVIGLAMFVIYVMYKHVNISNIAFNVSILAAVGVVAAAEEFFFRGYLQNKLAKDFGVITRIAIVTILFGVYKVSVFTSMRTFMTLAEIVVISCIGSVILSLELEKMQNLIAPVVSHALWDSLVYSNMERVPSWIMTTPQWTEALYQYMFKFSTLFCGHWEVTAYYLAGRQFITCSGCTGIYLGVFFAIFLYDEKLYSKLRSKWFYIPALLPMIFMFFGLNIAEGTGILDSHTLGSVQLQLLNYLYTACAFSLGAAGSILMVNLMKEDAGVLAKKLEEWLPLYEYIMIPVLLLALLSNPITNPQMTALIFFGVLVIIGVFTAIFLLVMLFGSILISFIK